MCMVDGHLSLFEVSTQSHPSGSVWKGALAHRPDVSIASDFLWLRWDGTTMLRSVLECSEDFHETVTLYHERFHPYIHGFCECVVIQENSINREY